MRVEGERGKKPPDSTSGRSARAEADDGIVPVVPWHPHGISPSLGLRTGPSQWVLRTSDRRDLSRELG